MYFFDNVLYIKMQSALSKIKHSSMNEPHEQIGNEQCRDIIHASNFTANIDATPNMLSEASLEDDSIQIFLFKSSEDEPLGIQLNEFLVVVSVQEGSPAYHANIPARHRVITVNHELVATLQDFGRVLTSTAKPLEIHLRLVPLGQKAVFHADLVDKAVVRMFSESDLDLSILSANPRFDFLNETSPYHTLFKQRYDATSRAIEFIERMVEAYKADKFAKSTISFSYNSYVIEESDSALRWLDAFTEERKSEENTLLHQRKRMATTGVVMRGESPLQGLPTFIHPTDLQTAVIQEAPMAVSESDLTLDSALKLSEEVFANELPYDPFLFNPDSFFGDTQEGDPETDPQSQGSTQSSKSKVLNTKEERHCSLSDASQENLSHPKQNSLHLDHDKEEKGDSHMHC